MTYILHHVRVSHILAWRLMYLGPRWILGRAPMDVEDASRSCVARVDDEHDSKAFGMHGK